MRHITLAIGLLLSTATFSQVICDELNAGFTWNATSAAGAAQFSNSTTGTGEVTTWLWNFGDGTTSNDAQPTHVFPGPGTYEVCLTAITIFIFPSGEPITCMDEFCAPVVIGGGGDPCDGLEVGFTWTATASGSGVIFSNGTSGTGFQTTWQWSFGDGATSNEAQPDHAYAAPGTYNVCLVATTIFETLAGLITCVDEYCAPVMVGGGGNTCDELEAGFAWTATTASGAVQFSNTTTGTGQTTTWQWFFGDGATSDDAQPSHVFPGPGIYQVCLVVTTVYLTPAGALTCVDEYCASVTIGGGGIICDELEAGFTWTSVGSGNGVIFSNGTTGTGFQTTWQWFFGDGATSSEAQPDHAYAEPGTYTVCLVATTIFETSAGLLTCVDEYCSPITVGGVNNCSWLSAGFTWAAGINGVEFNYQPTGPATAQYTYLWNFGDGTSATTQDAFHTYTAAGTYEVCLTVTAYLSNMTTPCTATSCQAVTWTSGGGDPCDGFEAGFTWSSPTATGNPVQFSNTTTGTGQTTTWQWIFGDGTTSGDAQPLHEFPGLGTYQVCLVSVTVFISASGAATTCADEYCATVIVAGEPEDCDPGFALTIESTPSNTGFILSASTNIPNEGITWTFANGLVLYGPTIQVGITSVLNIELCITAWYQPANSNDTCWTTVCGLLSELGFAVSVAEPEGEAISAWPNPAAEVLYVGPVGQSARVVIYGADGRMERDVLVNGDPARIDLSGLAPGLKSVAISMGDRLERFKIVKE